MPDNDIVYKNIRVPRWRRPLRLAREAASSEQEVADAILTATAEHFREKRGCEGVAQLAVAARNAARDALDAAWPEARDRFLRQNGQSQLAHRVVERAEFRLLTEPDGLRSPHSDHELAVDFMEKGLEGLVYEQLWARGQHLLGERFETYAEVQAFMERCTSNASLDRLAERALAHPDGHGLVAPAGRRAPASTAEQLYESVDVR